MPIFAGLISGFFGLVAQWIFARATLGVSVAAAFIVTVTASLVVVKVALAAVLGSLAAVLPPSGYDMVSYCIPTHLASYVTAILVADAIATSWSYWLLEIKQAASAVAT